MNNDVNLNKMNPQVELYEPVEITVVPPKNQPKLSVRDDSVDDLSSFPERVFTQEDVRLFNIKANLYKLSDNPSASEAVGLKNVAPVEVFDVEGRTLGYATIFQEKNYITCDSRIEYHSPERLSIQNNIPYYLIPYGEITYKEVKSKNGNLEIQSLDIKKLMLVNDAQASLNLWRVVEN